MKNLKYLTLILILFLYGCGTIKEGFVNQKKNSSDEFLVQKKSPLIMPPDYKELPEPNQNKMNSSDKDNNIKKLVTNKDNTVTNEKKTKQTNKKLEESLIEKIKKN